ncbi:hypothetical protein [Kribbella sp. CA-293567]|nr:hypothetical protein [Kribbella sp. CA-293567]WBQ04374.1 hypothetical protein OX958_30970 [Kribbella sp. CA-293567]
MPKGQMTPKWRKRLGRAKEIAQPALQVVSIVVNTIRIIADMT